MNIVDALINLICFSIQNLLLNLLPSDAPLYPLVTFKENLETIETFLIQVLSGFSLIFPMALLITIFNVIIVAELALFTFKIIKFAINVLRGSGA